jgi:hypothetical protein
VRPRITRTPTQNGQAGGYVQCPQKAAAIARLEPEGKDGGTGDDQHHTLRWRVSTKSDGVVRRHRGAEESQQYSHLERERCEWAGMFYARPAGVKTVEAFLALLPPPPLEEAQFGRIR